MARLLRDKISPMLKDRRKKSAQRLPKPQSVLVKQILIGVGLLILLGLIGYGIWHFTRLPAFNIQEVNVSGQQTLSEEIIRSAVEEELSGYHYKLIPYTFSFTYPRQKIIERLDSIDRIKNASLDTSDNTLSVTLEEYVPYALWCNRDLNGCYFLDKSGYAFEEAPTLVGSVFLRYVSGTEDPGKDKSLTTGSVMSETEVLAELFSSNFNFNTLYIELVDTEEVNYHLQGEAVLKVNLKQSHEEILTNLTAILNSDEFSHLNSGNFRYIDLRFGNKVFVQEEVVETATSTEEIVESE